MAIRKVRVLVVAAALAIAAAAQPAQAADRVLRVTLQLPLESHIGQNLVMFKDEVESGTNGAVEVQIIDSARLFKDMEVPGAVGSGEIEMGTVPLTHFSGQIPAVDIFYMPFLFNTEQLAGAAVEPGGTIRKRLEQAISRTGNRVLWWQAFGGAIMLSNGAPLKTPQAVKGKRVRVFGQTSGKFVDFIGGTPKPISASEQFRAYQEGVVDAGMTGIASVQSRSLWDVMDTVTVTNHAVIEFVVLVNEDVWAGLASAHKRVIEAAAANAEKAVRERIKTIEAEAFEAARDQGMTVYQLSPEEIDAWRKAAQPVYDDFRNSAGSLGAEMQQAARALLRKYEQ